MVKVGGGYLELLSVTDGVILERTYRILKPETGLSGHVKEQDRECCTFVHELLGLVGVLL